jgi:hypothetical protein
MGCQRGVGAWLLSGWFFTIASPAWPQAAPQPAAPAGGAPAAGAPAAAGGAPAAPAITPPSITPPSISAPQIPTLGPPAPAEPPKPEEGFDVVEIDLGTRKLDRTLPFDIPFYIVGKVPAETRRVGIQIAESAKKIRVEDFKPDWHPEPPVEWRHLPDLDQPDEKGRLTFRVLMQPLRPRRYYQLRFWISPTLQQTAAFRKAAVDVLDATLQDVQSVTLPNEQVKTLQTRLVESLRGSTVSGELLASGTLFDEANPVRLPDLKNASRPVLDPQSALRDAWSLYVVGQGRLRSDLVQIRDDPSLDKLVDLGRQSEALLQEYAQLQATYTKQKPADPNAPPQPQQPQVPPDVDLAEFLANLQEQVQRFTRITEMLKKYPQLLSDARRAVSALNEVETGFLQGPTDITSIAGVSRLFEDKDPAQIEKLVADYADTEEALGKLAAFLTAPDTTDLLQKLLEARELAPGLSAEEKSRLLGLVAQDGLITRARETAVSLQKAIRSAQVGVAERRRALEKLASDIGDDAHAEVLVLGSTSGVAATERRVYISADLGALYATGIGSVLPYVGVNVYFRPINKKVPLRQEGGLMRRLSLTAGVTIKGVADKDAAGRVQTRDDLFAGRVLLIGAGLRVTNSIRIGAGGVLFMKQSTNPLQDSLSLALAPYGSASIDINVKGVAKKLGDAVGGLFKK